jgi:PAS domain S-box-containing protein
MIGSVNYAFIRRASIIGFVSMLLALSAIGFYGFGQLNRLNAARISLRRSNELITTLHSIFSILQDAETGQRGFLITGNESYLAPYNDAVSKMSDGYMRHLRELTADNLAQSKDIAKLQQAIREKFAELKRTIEIRRTKGFDAARELVVTDIGKHEMDVIRDTFTKMYENERELLILRDEEQDRHSKFAFIGLFIVFASGLICQLVTGLVTLRFLKGEILARQALDESEKRFRLLLSSIKDYAISMIDPKGVVRTWNYGAERIFGYKADEIVGKNISLVYTEEEKASGKPEQELAVSTRVGRFEEEGMRVRRDGSKFWANVVVVPIFGKSEEVTGFAKVIRDISDRKQTIDTLREQADLLDLTRDAVVVRDLQGIVGYWNRGAEDMYGFTKAEAIGKPAHVLLKTEFPQPLGDVEKYILDKGYWEYELFHHTKDGRRIIVSSRHTLKTDEHGKPVGVLEIDTDITVHKESEQKQLALAEMKRVNAELDQFASIASHDLQEPLRAVAGCLQILEKTYRGKLGKDADELIDYAVDGSLRMRSLINALLSLARVNSGEMVFESVDLNSVLEQALQNIETAVKESGAKITHDPLPVLTVEKTLITQLFQNLLSNAIKFCAEKPPKIHIGAIHKDHFWQISVQDNGIGFDKQSTDKIFEPFKRLHNQKKYPGTGIGLPICKRIVERHGGTISAESELGKGATFYFTLIDGYKSD